jgi:ribonuclease P protein component
MLPRRERLSRAQFPKGRGVSFTFPFGTVRVFPSQDFRIAVVISKKTIRSAVFRHKGKRKGYDALSVLRDVRAAAGYVFYPNREVLTTSVAAMKNELVKKFLKNS